MIYSYAIGAEDDLDRALADLSSVNVMLLATWDIFTIDSDASFADADAALSDGNFK